MTGQLGLDTTFLVDFFKGDKGAIAFFDKNADRLVVHDLVIYEFLCGNLTKSQAELVQEKIQLLPSVQLDRQAMVNGALLFRQQKRIGKSIGHFDAIVASGYMSKNINQIVTRNERHFKSIPHLLVKGY